MKAVILLFVLYKYNIFEKMLQTGKKHIKILTVKAAKMWMIGFDLTVFQGVWGGGCKCNQDVLMKTK